jgi:cellulose synthase/poly-beta-1,6-N-acetylglucosamine synthase-like glycosyltransferase
MTPLPSVSVIIIARDEEKWLPACLHSLTQLDYPFSKLEFIMVNDRSKDRTGHIMNQFAGTYPNAKAISLKKISSNSTGKIQGLIQAVKRSKGEILFFTDADCTVPQTWIRSLLHGLDENTGMVGGFLQLEMKNDKSTLFSHLQSIDWIYLTSMGSSWAIWGVPLSIFGNNFLIRRNLYHEIGGFQSVYGHILEDFALLRNLRNRSKSHVRIILDRKCLVTTRPAKNLSEFFTQRKRWSIGARSHGFFVYLLMTTTFLAHFMTLFVFFKGWILSGLAAYAILLFFDLLVLIRPLKILHRLDLLLYFPLYELYYFGYTLFFAPVFLLGRTATWKRSRLKRYS